MTSLSTRRQVLAILILSLFFLLLTLPAAAQQTGQLSGAAVDSNGDPCLG